MNRISAWKCSARSARRSTSTSAILRNSLNFNLLYIALYGTLQSEAILLKETIYHLHAPIHTNIALLTDLHNRPYQSIIDSLTVHRPDTICIAGDLIYSITPIGDTPFIQRESNVLPFLVACRKLAPTFFLLEIMNGCFQMLIFSSSVQPVYLSKNILQSHQSRHESD